MLGHTGIWQNWLGSLATWWNIQIQVNQTKVSYQMVNPGELIDATEIRSYYVIT